MSATPSPTRRRRARDESRPQGLQPQSRASDQRHVKVLSADDTLVPLHKGPPRGDPLAA